MLRRLAVVLTAAASTFTAAHAADLATTYQRSPGYVDMTHYTQPWQGFYVGAVGGFGRGDIRFKQFTTAGTSLGLPGGFPSDGTINGATLGITVGANAEVAHVVFGFEGDLGWAHLTGSQNFASGAVDAKMDSLSTIRARLGYDLGHFLPFVTAGWGWTHSKLTIPGGGAPVSSVSNEQGFVWGGGLEYAIDNHWSVKGEYLYAKTDIKFDYTTIVPPSGTTLETAGHVDLFRAGVNYRF